MSTPARMFNGSVIRTVLIILYVSRTIFPIPVTNDYSVELLSASTITHTSPAPDFTTELQNASVCRAAATSDKWEECIAFLETLLNKDCKEYGQLQDVKDSFRLSGQSPLPQVAATRGYTKLIKVLLRNGVPINKKYWLKETVLHISAKSGHKDLTAFLMTQGADIEAKNMVDNTPLQEAVSYFQLTTVKLLLDAGADVNSINMVAQTPLYDTVNNLKLPENICNALNSNEVAEIENSRYVIGETIIKLLLEHGADTNIANYQRKTPLHIAAETCNSTIIKLLVEGGANINATDVNNQTPLHRAAVNNNVSVVEFLVTMGCDKTITDKRKRTALDIAGEKNFTKIIDLLSREE